MVDQKFGVHSRIAHIAMLFVYAYLIFVPWATIWTLKWSGHDLSRIAELLILVPCVTAVAAVWIRSGSASRINAYAGAAFVLLASASVLLAPQPVWAAREAILWVGLGCLALTVSIVCSTEKAEKTMVAVLCIGGALYSGLVLVVAGVYLAQSAELELFALFVGYNNYRLFNHVQTAMLPLLAIAVGLRGQQRILRWLGWASLSLGFAFLTFTAGRATVLGLVVGLALSGLLFRRKVLPTLRFLVMGIAIGLVLYGVVFVALPWLTSSSVEAAAARTVAGLESDHSRFMLWKIAIADIARAPWLGIGPMHYSHGFNGKAAHPHNVYLQIAAEWGLPMLLLIAGICVRAIVRMARAIRSCQDAGACNVGIGLFVAIIAIAVDGAFSGNFVMPVSQVWIAVVIGWSMAWTRRHGKAAVMTNAWRMPRVAHVCVAVALCASQLWLWASVWPEVRDVDGHLARVNRDLSHGGKPMPRFWSNGWF